MSCNYIQLATWLNYLADEVEHVDRGYKLLHEIASHGRPSRNDSDKWEAWEYVIDVLDKSQVWRTLTFNPLFNYRM